MTEQQIQTIRDLRGFAIPWARVAAAVGVSEAACRAALGVSMPDPPEQRPRLPWDRQDDTE